MVTNYYENQSEKREASLKKILSSTSDKKIIVSGPGTGKTYTFNKLFRNAKGKKFLALTFINNLVADMEKEFGDIAEVSTFHSYARSLLHKRFGAVTLFPHLKEIIKEDSSLSGGNLKGITRDFQTLQINSERIKYFLHRGNYYNAVGFDDSVYKVLEAVNQEKLYLPPYDQIVIDEFQDFNVLEASLLKKLEEKGPILIVGDDDQAVYAGRNATNEHLRRKWNSGDYEQFVLPYCSRCPRGIVEATASFIKNAIDSGGLKGRIEKPFYPFIEGENQIGSRIQSAELSTIQTLTKFLEKKILEISKGDIAEATKKNIPCVLIVGSSQYLNPINKAFAPKFNGLVYKDSRESFSYLDGYKLLEKDIASNLGWRILAGLALSNTMLKKVIIESSDGTPIKDVLQKEFVEQHEKILGILAANQIDETGKVFLGEIFSGEATPIIQGFFPDFDKTEEPEVENEEQKGPIIKLTSFEGSKGLSAQHVFVIGFNQGVIPRFDKTGEINDFEYSRFIVAITRARKSLSLLSNRYDFSPKNGRNYKSSFLPLIDPEYIDDAGYIKAENV